MKNKPSHLVDALVTIAMLFSAPTAVFSFVGMLFAMSGDAQKQNTKVASFLLLGTFIISMSVLIYGLIRFEYRIRSWYKVRLEKNDKIRTDYAFQEKVKEVERSGKRTRDAVERAGQQRFVDDLRSRAAHEPVVAQVIGRGLPSLQPGAAALITCRSDSLHISTILERYDFPIHFESINNIEIFGPGKTVRGGNFVGGGFGLQGAAEGILIASVLNALTTKTKIETYISIRFNNTEIVLQIAKLAPMDLRLTLSPALVAVDSAPMAPARALALR